MNTISQEDYPTILQNIGISFPGKAVQYLSMSPKGDYLTLCGKRGAVSVLDLNNPWELYQRFKAKTSNDIGALKCSRNPDIIATAKGNLSNPEQNGGDIHLWKREKRLRWTCVKQIKSHSRPIASMGWNKVDDGFIASCAADSKVNVWDVRNISKPVLFKSLQIRDGQPSIVSWNRFIPTLIAVVHGGKVSIYDFRNPNAPIAKIFADISDVVSFDWSYKNRNVFVTSSRSYKFKIWDISSPDTYIGTGFTGFAADKVTFTPFGSGFLASSTHSNALELYSMDPKDNTCTMVDRIEVHTGSVICYCWRRAFVKMVAEYQVISWGTEGVLRMTTIEPQDLELCRCELSPTQVTRKKKYSILSNKHEKPHNNERERRVPSNPDVISPRTNSQIKSLEGEFETLIDIPGLVVEEKNASNRSMLVSFRTTTVSKSILRIHIIFPSLYPIGAPPSFSILHNETGVNDEKILEDVISLSNNYVTQRHTYCLNQCLRKLSDKYVRNVLIKDILGRIKQLCSSGLIKLVERAREDQAEKNKSQKQNLFQLFSSSTSSTSPKHTSTIETKHSPTTSSLSKTQSPNEIAMHTNDYVVSPSSNIKHEGLYRPQKNKKNDMSTKNNISKSSSPDTQLNDMTPPAVPVNSPASITNDHVLHLKSPSNSPTSNGAVSNIQKDCHTNARLENINTVEDDDFKLPLSSENSYSPALLTSPSIEQKIRKLGPDYMVYLVCSGDTLPALALTYGMDKAEIRNVNHIHHSGQLWPGKAIIVKKKTTRVQRNSGDSLLPRSRLSSRNRGSTISDGSTSRNGTISEKSPKDNAKPDTKKQISIPGSTAFSYKQLIHRRSDHHSPSPSTSYTPTSPEIKGWNSIEGTKQRNRLLKEPIHLVKWPSSESVYGLLTINRRELLFEPRVDSSKSALSYLPYSLALNLTQILETTVISKGDMRPPDVKNDQDNCIIDCDNQHVDDALSSAKNLSLDITIDHVAKSSVLEDSLTAVESPSSTESLDGVEVEHFLMILVCEKEGDVHSNHAVYFKGSEERLRETCGILSRALYHSKQRQLVMSLNLEGGGLERSRKSNLGSSSSGPKRDREREKEFDGESNRGIDVGKRRERDEHFKHSLSFSIDDSDSSQDGNFGRLSQCSKIIDGKAFGLIRDSLPGRFRDYTWDRIFCTETDGTSLKTFYNRLCETSTTIILIQTADGDILGGFATEAWHINNSFYGTGESLVFSFCPSYRCYHWTGGNDHFMISTKEFIAMGGGPVFTLPADHIFLRNGGRYAFYLDSDFLWGTSETSNTYLNRSLTQNEEFKCTVVEVWACRD